MREILFRGKRVDNGEWVEGFYHYTNYINPTTREVIETAHYILPIACQDAYRVIPETVGQFTGLTDKNGKKIFEGDIVKKSWTYHFYVGNQKRSQINAFIGRIVFKSGSYRMKEQGEFIGTSHNGEWLEVISNIHDNPELLEV